MATIEYNEVKERRFIVLDGEPYEVLSSHVFRKQQRKPVNATKLKNLLTGSVREHSFGSSDKVDEAEIEEREITYLYNNRGEFWFCEAKDKSQRFKIESEKIADKIIYVRPNENIKLLTFNEKFVAIKTPVKAELRVKEAAPAVRGNTVQGGNKKVILETGAEVSVPMFVNEGDTLVINTETGEYVERREKK
ncbi:elongation factor P [Candidatus Nomurabacteria bacterium]|nr:elongation factor P [Candidatus Nomurabacteria bacterium]